MLPRLETLQVDLLTILADTSPNVSDGGAAKIALYGMFSAVGVALISGLFALLVSRYGGKERPSDTGNQSEAWERWFLLHDIDPRRITSGFETMEEVRRVQDTP